MSAAAMTFPTRRSTRVTKGPRARLEPQGRVRKDTKGRRTGKAMADAFAKAVRAVRTAAARLGRSKAGGAVRTAAGPAPCSGMEYLLATDMAGGAAAAAPAAALAAPADPALRLSVTVKAPGVTPSFAAPAGALSPASPPVQPGTPALEAGAPFAMGVRAPVVARKRGAAAKSATAPRRSPTPRPAHAMPLTIADIDAAKILMLLPGGALHAQAAAAPTADAEAVDTLLGLATADPAGPVKRTRMAKRFADGTLAGPTKHARTTAVAAA